MQKVKVVLICTGLHTPGGIERAIVNLGNLLSSNGIDTTILILDTTSHSFYEIQPQIKISQENLHFGITQSGNVFSRKLQFVNHIKKLRQLLREIQPSIVISTEYNLTIASYLTYQRKAKLISWEHHHFYWIQKNKFWQFLFKIIYPKVDKVVCLNKTEAALFNRQGCKTTVIPNFTPNQSLVSHSENKNLLTIGWLIKRKGIDLIPQIAEKIKIKHPDWKWQIIGSGPLHKILQQEIDKRNLKHFLIVAPPTSPNLTSVYVDTSIYVMTSRFECFPMVLLEAMSYGIPCISFDCPTGPADIIQHNEDGLLIDLGNVDAVADAICSLIENEEKRKKMGKKAQYNVQRFSPEIILNQWQQLFEES